MCMYSPLFLFKIGVLLRERPSPSRQPGWSIVGVCLRLSFYQGSLEVLGLTIARSGMKRSPRTRTSLVAMLEYYRGCRNFLNGIG